MPVIGEDFPAGRSIQLGLASGAQSHTVFGRNEPAMIHYHRSLQAALRGETADAAGAPPVRHGCPPYASSTGADRPITPSAGGR